MSSPSPNQSANGVDNNDYDELEDIPFVDGGPTLGDVIFQPEKPSATDSRELPYKMVYKKHENMKYYHESVFIPNEPIRVRITNYERNMTKHILNPYLYTIELEHGPFSWTLYKRYKHFFSLHQQLKLFRATLLIPFPTDVHRIHRETLKKDEDEIDRPRVKFPRLPNKPEALIGHSEVEERVSQLEEYLTLLLKIRLYRDHHETLKFLSVCHLSFMSDLGVKSIEGLIKKQTGSTKKCICCDCYCFGLFQFARCTRLMHICSDSCGCWRERWLIVKDTWVGLLRPRDAQLRRVLLFDEAFQIASSLYSSSMEVSNLHQRVVFKCSGGRRKRNEWCDEIRGILERQGAGFKRPNRHHGSFAPPRGDSSAQWLVDGAEYMEAVADAIIAAREEIFIADWWLSPEIHLKCRPVSYQNENENETCRLDELLHRKAAEGVKIFVLLYKEVEMALGINSYYSKCVLSRCHEENIKVLRHPDRATSGVFLWAHHEKIVCIDQSIAFVGGIDLCYGRWDDQHHRLVDLGSGAMDQTKSADDEKPFCKKFTSSRPLGITPIENNNRNTDENVTITEEFLKCDSPESQRKSLYETMQQSTKSLLSKLTMGPDENEPIVEEEVNRKVVQKQLQQQQEPLEQELPCAKYWWLGKDYCNFIVKDFSDLDSPYTDLVDRKRTPRMPWHDVGMMVHGAAARDVARHFIERWNATKLQKAKKLASYPYLTPKSYQNFYPPSVDLHHGVSCQVLRSISSWSGGYLDANKWEESIHEAYLSVISRAQYYIYIENQFFISLASRNSVVNNLVCEQLCKRIVRAHREKSVFRVFVVLPLLPGFEGQVGTRNGTALHAITHWNYASICRGQQSLIEQLKSSGIDEPEQYVSFHGLRTYEEFPDDGTLVTELIYVHSKLMVVDDRIVICGSANINDRSLIGRRDSEIAVLIMDEQLEVDGLMNGESVKVGGFASSLRKRLFSEHLGVNISDSSLIDPISDSFYHDKWRFTSNANTTIYEQVFRCIPSDSIPDFKELEEYLKETPLCNSDPESAKIKVKEIKGHLVNFPLKFLYNQILTPNAASMEGIMPTSLWI